MNLIRIGIASALAIGLAHSQNSPAPRPEFEVASIKLDPNCGTRPRSIQGSPGRLNLECVTLEYAIQSAYGLYADGLRFNGKLVRVSGGPGWIRSDYYDILAKAEGDHSRAQMYGPMLQALLEDRFRLKRYYGLVS